MLKSPVLKAIATERPVIIKGADSSSISPKLNKISFILPLEKGPEIIMIRPEKASEKGISCVKAARRISTTAPTKKPPKIHTSEAIIDLVESSAKTFLKKDEILNFLIF
jgi:hypothetical protein